MRYSIQPNKKTMSYKESLLGYGCFINKEEALKYALKTYKARSYIVKRFESQPCTQGNGIVFLGKKVEEFILTRSQIIEILGVEK